MAGQTAAGQKGGDTSGLTNDQANKITLMMLGALLLLVFMDMQAGRHFRSVAGFDASQKSDSQSEQPLLPALSSAFSLEPVGEESASPAPARKLPPGLSEVPETTEEFPPAYSVETTQLFLYFFKFKGRGTELVRVRRSHDGTPMSLRRVVEALQEGPVISERGLLNAFDKRIKLHRVGVRDGIAFVDVGDGMERMGARIIQDRIDQLTLTLTQFPAIRGVRIYLNGKQVSTLGDEKLPLAGTLTPPDRKVSAYD